MASLSYLGNALLHAVQLLVMGLLPCVVYAFLMQKCSNAIRIRLASLLGVKGYIYLTFPGVMIHELSHALFCLLFFHRITEMKLFSPEADGTLGYVNHAYNPKNPYHRIGNFYIGTGPVWGGLLVILLISRWLLPSGNWGELLSLQAWSRWQTWLWLYLFLTVSSHITLSAPDLQGALDGGVFIILLVFALTILLDGYCRFTDRAFEQLTALWSTCAPPLVAGLLLSAGTAILLALLIRKRVFS